MVQSAEGFFRVATAAFEPNQSRQAFPFPVWPGGGDAATACEGIHLLVLHASRVPVDASADLVLEHKARERLLWTLKSCKVTRLGVVILSGLSLIIG